MLLRKYGFKVCVILFGFYSTRFKVNINLPCINTQQRTTARFDDTFVVSSSNRQNTVLYQGSADCCEVDRNSGIIRLIQQSRAIHYCNQLVLAIFPHLNIFVFVITIVDLILRSALIRFSLLLASYLYNSTGLGCYVYTV